MQPEHCREEDSLPPGKPTMRRMTGIRNDISRRALAYHRSVPTSPWPGDNRGGPQAGPHVTVAMEE